MDALEKFVEESSLPVITEFNNDPSNHPFVIKFFNNPNEKVYPELIYFLNMMMQIYLCFSVTY